jgi:dihydrofolate reductase
VRLIWAQARGGVIGHRGVMPWRLPEDLAHFKATTVGRPVIMGRRTWESIPDRFRPLPGRENIVVTRDHGWNAPGATAAHTLEEALEQSSTKAWVIGGAQIYAAALPYATVAVVTEIDAEFPGDAWAPELDSSWQLERDADWAVSTTGLRYRFLTYTR